MEPEDPFTPRVDVNEQQPTSSTAIADDRQGVEVHPTGDFLIDLASGVKMEVDDAAVQTNGGDVEAQTVQPQIKIKIQGTDGRFCHEVAEPNGHPESDRGQWENSPQSLMVFPFHLDSYQEAALKCVERDHSTIVAAPAAAGKSIVVKYLMAKATKEHLRVLYITPYESLCRRKLRELSDDSASVGYISPADDVMMEPHTSCVLMTVATLRRMLQGKSAALEGISWIVFDEAHCIGDKGIGQLYEETLMLMWSQNNGGRSPFKLLILTDPISNLRQLAKWVADRQQEPCHYIASDSRRALPRQHFVYSTVAADKLALTVNHEGNFVNPHFEQAMEKHRKALERNELARKAAQNGVGSSTAALIVKEEPLSTHVVKILRTLRELNKFPVIVFCANERNCEEVVSALSIMDFLPPADKARVSRIYDAVVALLESNADKRLPMIVGYKLCLLRGIGVHHPGQLPLLNELTETLHDKGYVKVLITTEVFARETKLSARSVVIAYSRKLDGHAYRPLTNGEYSLMAGRAGRRGKDERGWVLLLLDREMGAPEAEKLMVDTPPLIKSQLSMNPNFAIRMMITRVEPIDVFKKTFQHYYADSDIDKLQKEIDALEEKRDGMIVQGEKQLEDYHAHSQLVEHLTTEMRAKLLAPEYVVPFLSDGVGRLLHLVHADHDYGWGALVFFDRRPQPDNPLATDRACVVDVAVRVASVCVPSDNHAAIDLALVRPPPEGDEGVIAVLRFTYDCIRAVSTIRLKLPERLDEPEGRRLLQETLKENIQNRLAGEVPELNPNEDMAVKDKALKRLGKELEDQKRKLRERLERNPDYRDGIFNANYAKYLKKLEVGKEVDALRAEKERHQGLELANRYDAYNALFAKRERYYLCRDGSVNMNSLSVVLSFSVPGAPVMAELLMDGVFNELAPSAVAALLSCFVPLEEKAGWVKLSLEMETLLRKTQGKAKELAEAAQEVGIEFAPPEKAFPGHLMDSVRKWVDGASFQQIAATDVLEGAVVRCLRGVDLLLTEMIDALPSLPNANPEDHRRLLAMLNKTRKLLRRSVPFAKSLYLR